MERISFSKFLFRGEHFNSSSDILFDSILIELDRLDEWSGDFIKSKEDIATAYKKFKNSLFSISGIDLKIEGTWFKIGKRRYKKAFLPPGCSPSDYFKKTHIRIFPKGKNFIYI